MAQFSDQMRASMAAKLGGPATESSSTKGSEAAADESAADLDVEGNDEKEEPVEDAEAEESLESDSESDDSEDDARKPKRRLSRYERRVKNLNQRLKDSESERTRLQRESDARIRDLERRLEALQLAPPQHQAGEDRPGWLDEIMESGEVPKELVKQLDGLKRGQKETQDAVFGIMADARAERAIQAQGELPEYVNIDNLKLAAYTAIHEDGRASAKALALAVAKELERQEEEEEARYHRYVKRFQAEGAQSKKTAKAKSSTVQKAQPAKPKERPKSWAEVWSRARERLS